MTSITFQNPGEIDPRSWTTFGLNAKPNSTNPIGFFGTGLKYAIAITMRLGGSLTIWSGKTKYTFTTEKTDFRGKEFQAILCQEGKKKPFALPFTTELGKKWEPWMAFRELYCNAMDEDGETYDYARSPATGSTTIIVSEPEIFECFAKRSAFLLSPEQKPLAKLRGVEIFPGRSNGVYYRGILVGQTEEDHEFTYNLVDAVELTEDRTLKYQYVFKHRVVAALMSLGVDQENIVRKTTTGERNSFEASLPWTLSGYDPNDEFLEVVGNLRREGANVVDLVRELHDQYVKKDADPERIALTNREHEMLLRAMDVLKKQLGYDFSDLEIVPVRSLGPSTFGLARKGKIFLARRAFEAGQVWVTGTLLEEYGHVRLHWRDETRDMQNALINLTATLAERLHDCPQEA